MSRRQNPEIALAMNVGITHLERVARGIREYGERRNWRFLLSPETRHLSPAALEGWKGDGVIALANSTADREALFSLDCPVVDLSGAFPKSRFARVRPDYEEIGRIAARHFLDRGYRRFGFYGLAEAWYSSRYRTGFIDEIQSRDLDCATLEVTTTLGEKMRWDTGQAELELWLSGFTPPFAIMAAHDPRAAMAIRASERIGLRIPEDVAIIGVNNDTGSCESCRPPLSSIERNDAQVGLAAARLLERLIAGRDAPKEDLVVTPGAIRERQSTNSLAVEHPDLVVAIEFAQEHFREPIGVSELVEASPRSRRWLEEAFSETLDCSPRAFLFHLRYREAQRLQIENPGIPKGELARRCGYSGTRQLNSEDRRRRTNSASDTET